MESPRYFVGNFAADTSQTIWGVFDSQDDVGGEFPINTFSTPHSEEDLWAALTECKRLNGGVADLRLVSNDGDERVLRMVSDGGVEVPF